MEKENTMLGIRRLAVIFLPCLILPFLGLSANTVVNEVNGVNILPAGLPYTKHWDGF